MNRITVLTMPDKKKEKHAKGDAKDAKGKKKGGGVCGCLSKQEAHDEDERKPLLERDPKDSELSNFDYVSDDDDEEDEEMPPIPLTIVVPPPREAAGPGPGRLVTSCWGNRPRFVEITLFLYNLAYRASIPLKEQFIFGVVAMQYSPSGDEFSMSNDDRLQACQVGALI